MTARATTRKETSRSRDRTRTRLILAVIAWVAFWPLAHRALVAVYDVNPWKLAGWAMYTVPTPPVLVVAFEPRGSGGVPIDLRRLPAHAQQALRRFEARRHVLGNLVRPGDFAALVLDARPDLPELVVMVQRMVLDPADARMTSRTMRYAYGRDGLRSERAVPPVLPPVSP